MLGSERAVTRVVTGRPWPSPSSRQTAKRPGSLRAAVGRPQFRAVPREAFRGRPKGWLWTRYWSSASPRNVERFGWRGETPSPLLNPRRATPLCEHRASKAPLHGDPLSGRRCWLVHPSRSWMLSNSYVAA